MDKMVLIKTIIDEAHKQGVLDGVFTPMAGRTSHISAIYSNGWKNFPYQCDIR